MSLRGGKRNIHTNIAVDDKFNSLINTYGSGIGLFYLMLLPHSRDDAAIEEISVTTIKGKVCPLVHYFDEEEIEVYLTILNNAGLLYWDKEGERIIYNPRTFYTYQNNVPVDRRRLDADFPHPVPRIDAGKKRSVAIETQQKFESVWKIVPAKYRRPITMNAVKRAILEHSVVPQYDVEQCMISVLEKFGNKRDDIGSLFAKSLQWKQESIEENSLGASAGYTDWIEHYEHLRQQSLKEIE